MCSTTRLARATCSLVLAVLLAALPACSSGPEPLNGLVRDPLLNVAQVSLPNAASGGAPFQMVADDDGLLLVYFGYTYCPDICPTTMADLRTAMEDLDGADRIDVAFITVDPFRDDVEQVTNYVTTFFPEGIALRTDDQERLAAAATAFEASYELSIDPDGTIDVGHSSLLYAIDFEGTILVQWPFGMSADEIREDLEQLLDGA